METTFTKGKAKDIANPLASNRDSTEFYNEAKEPIFTIRHHELTADEAAANAKLIAAAPELLEAAKKAIKSINPESVSKNYLGNEFYVGSKTIPSDEAIILLIEAIKKATE